jgi:hypothetical protein
MQEHGPGAHSFPMQHGATAILPPKVNHNLIQAPDEATASLGGREAFVRADM